MKSIYLKMTLPMMLATVCATAQSSSDSVDPQITTEENLFPSYDNRIKLGVSQFGGNSAILSYERLKLQSMYFGVEAAAYQQGSIWLTALVGYNFLLSSKDRLTPLVGMDYFKWKHFDNHCPVAGMLYEHAFTDRVRLGANVKTNLRTLVAGEPRFYLGVPFTVQVGEQKRWELGVQPYTVCAEGLGFSHHSVGLQSSIAYRF